MKAYYRTDIGRVRQANQDYIFAVDEPIGSLPNLFIVADGMGGHNAGDFASKYTVEHVVEYIRKSSEKDSKTLMENALHEVNEQLIKIAGRDVSKQGMGTTFVAASIDNDHLCAFNVGDSRLYLIDSTIEQVTMDHSYVAEMVQQGRLDKKAARIHPRRNVITRAIGAFPETKVDIFEREVSRGDYVLLCSDGLTGMVEDNEIERIIRTGADLVDKVDALINAANENGGTDNISVILIEK